jgi:hypothetical protein
MTPHYALTGQKPKAEQFRIFGCTVFIKRQEKDLISLTIIQAQGNSWGSPLHPKTFTTWIKTLTELKQLHM